MTSSTVLAANDLAVFTVSITVSIAGGKKKLSNIEHFNTLSVPRLLDYMFSIDLFLQF